MLGTVLGIEIDHVEHVERRHVIDAGSGSKAVRLNTYVKDGSGRIFDVEMQVCTDPALARRSRYYHVQMAAEQLERDASYRDLSDAYPIFFCLYNPFALGRRVYSFESMCIEAEGLALGDGARTVFLAATSPSDDSQPDSFNFLLDYIADGGAAGSLTERMDGRAREVIGSCEWRREYMLLEWRDKDNVEKGRREGKQHAEDRMSRLFSALLVQGRVNDAAKATSDPAERERLMTELGIDAAEVNG